MKKESNILFYLLARSMGIEKSVFRNKIVILSRPNFNEDFYNYTRQNSININRVRSVDVHNDKHKEILVKIIALHGNVMKPVLANVPNKI